MTQKSSMSNKTSVFQMLYKVEIGIFECILNKYIHLYILNIPYLFNLHNHLVAVSIYIII